MGTQPVKVPSVDVDQTIITTSKRLACKRFICSIHVLGRPSPIKQCLQAQAEFGPESWPSGSPSLLLSKVGKTKPNQEIGILGVASGKNTAPRICSPLALRICPSHCSQQPHPHEGQWGCIWFSSLPSLSAQAWWACAPKTPGCCQQIHPIYAPGRHSGGVCTSKQKVDEAK